MIPAAVLLGLVASAHAAGSTFGPQGCVTLDRSSAGSCVLSTDCQGIDISAFEFSFDCADQDGGIVRHSFGNGGFDANEDFDTEVKCSQCMVPNRHSARGHKKAVQLPLRSRQSAGVNQVPPAPMVVSPAPAPAPAISTSVAPPAAEGVRTQFGPEKCVATWLEKGHCMMETQCKDVDIGDYNFGLICLDALGAAVRHLFGKGSFDAEETFDTMIPCHQCVGLEDIVDSVIVGQRLEEMTGKLDNITGMITTLSENVQKLNEKVFPAGASSAAAALPHLKSTHHRKLVRHNGATKKRQAIRRNLRQQPAHLIEKESTHVEHIAPDMDVPEAERIPDVPRYDADDYGYSGEGRDMEGTYGDYSDGAGQEYAN